MNKIEVVSSIKEIVSDWSNDLNALLNNDTVSLSVTFTTLVAWAIDVISPILSMLILWYILRIKIVDFQLKRIEAANKELTKKRNKKKYQDSDE